MQVNWLFESDTFGEEIKGIVEEVKRQGHNAVMVDKVPMRTGESFKDLFPADACVLFYGSLGFSEQIKTETQWVPGSIHNSENFEWLNYHSHFTHYLMADTFNAFKYKDLINNKDFIYYTCGIEDTIFMRPNSGNKPFAGQLMEKKHFDIDVPRMGYGDINPEEYVIISEPVDIDTEWRFIVADRQVVTGSQYLPFRMRLHTREDDTVSQWMLESRQDDIKALAFAKQVVAEVDWEPDRAWTLDICKTAAGNYYVIEINSFSCSGFYKCNRQEIVKHISQIALDEWGKKHGQK